MSMDPDIRELDGRAAFKLGGQRYELVRIVEIAGTHRVRVHVQRDSYEFQSFATADLLSIEAGWIRLVEEPTAEWLPSTPSPYAPNMRVDGAIGFVLGSIADQLAYRAAVVLGCADDTAGVRSP